MNLSSGKIWPYAIAGAVTMVFGFCVSTIFVTSKAYIQESDAYMTKYQDADANINDFIKAKIAFDKKYTIAYVPATLKADNSVVSYKITDKAGNVVKDAKLILATSRPETAKLDQKLSSATFHDGVYSFNGLKFPKAGVWNLVTKVSVGKDYRFYNIKADTRNTNAYEY